MIGQQVLKRIQSLHKIGYIHRDIKPSNLVIGNGQNLTTVHLIDFGLSENYKKVKKFENDKVGMAGTKKFTSE